MKKHGIITLIIFCGLATVRAQNTGLSILAPAGGLAKTSTLSLEWTLGEYAVESLISGGKMYTQGFNQPFLVFAVADEKPAAQNLYTVSIFPNPVLSILNFSINSSKKLDVNVAVSDIQGRMYMHRSVTSLKGQLQLDFNGMPSGTYILSVRETISNQLIKTYQIVRL